MGVSKTDVQVTEAPPPEPGVEFVVGSYVLGRGIAPAGAETPGEPVLNANFEDVLDMVDELGGALRNSFGIEGHRQARDGRGFALALDARLPAHRDYLITVNVRILAEIAAQVLAQVGDTASDPAAAAQALAAAGFTADTAIGHALDQWLVDYAAGTAPGVKHGEAGPVPPALTQEA